MRHRVVTLTCLMHEEASQFLGEKNRSLGVRYFPVLVEVIGRTLRMVLDSVEWIVFCLDSTHCQDFVLVVRGGQNLEDLS